MGTVVGIQKYFFIYLNLLVVFSKMAEMILIILKNQNPKYFRYAVLFRSAGLPIGDPKAKSNI